MKFLFNIEITGDFEILAWANTFEYLCFLNPNNWQNANYPHGVWQKMLAVSNFSLPYSFLDENLPKNEWLFGYLSYDLKNQLENLRSQNPDYLQFPESLCFTPEWLLIWQNSHIIEVWSKNSISKTDFIKNLRQITYPTFSNADVHIQPRTSKAEYVCQVEKIRQHIIDGDVYELNYCIDFFAQNASIEPIQTYLNLCKISPMPFSAFVKAGQKYILCASPERFLKKIGKTIISQPIKGTIRRGKNATADETQKQKLFFSEKERAENMMIVDLVRNDLARSAKIGSTCVSEMFGMYAFPKVWQMISTIEAEMRENISPQAVIRHAFPMGSMTGAPKIKAMELIDNYENIKRGVFSGAIGYFSPSQDFDFNVIIRSIFYDEAQKYLSFMVGSAITYDSQAEQEYAECLLKAEAIQEVLKRN
ncbi:MAG: anthranilate synthase component I family protein [Raineya sp.]|nr:anthranilate synthase component I family protein [Raineya sp.]MDW8297079.1 anthranilate synthase component I family protein [Raineya sp.]